MIHILQYKWSVLKFHYTADLILGQADLLSLVISPNVSFIFIWK
jgi:hypothetical protein